MYFCRPAWSFLDKKQLDFTTGFGIFKENKLLLSQTTFVVPFSCLLATTTFKRSKRFIKHTKKITRGFYWCTLFSAILLVQKKVFWTIEPEVLKCWLVSGFCHTKVSFLILSKNKALLKYSVYLMTHLSLFVIPKFVSSGSSLEETFWRKLSKQ